MKIGILTFHSQLNYGGILQCWALQTALKKLGYDVAVIDRWLDVNNSLLEGNYKQWGVVPWVKFLARSLIGLGDINHLLRAQRTKKFIKEYLHLTPYHFDDWKNAPEDLGVDMLVVGSDQVWHCGDWSDPRVYLLDGAPRIPSVAYAASFGMVSLPQRFVPLYKSGLGKYTAISCREREGVVICNQLGVAATHVVDPTQLLNASDWVEGLALPSHIDKKGKRTLVCYMLSEDIYALIPHLIAFARKEDCRVKIFLNSVFALPFPKSVGSIKRYVSGLCARCSPRIEIMDSAGPRQFVEAFANADWVLSDSFHALMFSLTFGCNVRILAPMSEYRRNMFARIEEFAAHMDGRLVVADAVNALDSFACGEIVAVDAAWLENKRNKSMDFLKKACA